MAKKKSKQAPPPPQQRNLADEMAQISAAAQANAQGQANLTVQTAGRLANQAIKSTDKIAKKLDNKYTAAANQNLRDAGTSSAQLGQSSDQIGQVADRVATYNDPAQARLNQMALGQLYRPDQISSQAVAADQAQGARVDNVGRMQASQASPASMVQGPQGYSPAEIRAQQINASQAGPVANVQAASMGAPEQVSGTRVSGVGPMQGARVGRVQDVRSQDIQASAAERALMREATGGGLIGQLQNQASTDLSLGRSLSAEQSRDAIQSARAGYAARGLGLGQSALAAEMLNRDRYATQRQNERRVFASNVAQQAAGIQQAANQAYTSRMDANRGRQLQSGLANQSVAQARAMQNAQFAQQAGITDNQNAQQRVLAEAGYAQQAGLSNQDFAFRSASQNAQLAQQAGLANQSAGLTLGQSNAQLLQQAALANQSAGLQAGQVNQNA